MTSSPRPISRTLCAALLAGALSLPAHAAQLQLNAALAGEDGYDGFGVSVSGAGDVNGDGYDDAIVGAFSTWSSSGQAFVYEGIAGGDTAVDSGSGAADDTANAPGDSGGGSIGLKGGCACASGAPAPGWVGMVVALGMLLRRRRAPS